MNSRGRQTLRRRIGTLCAISSVVLCTLTGCSKPKAPGPFVTVSVAGVTTNAGGDVLVQLALTNSSTRAVLLSVRSTIYHREGAWVTNFGNLPRFAGLAGPGSEFSDAPLAPGQGIITALTLLRMAHPFRIEFVGFPSRVGVVGIADKAQDKLRQLGDGSQHDSYLGQSFFLTTPAINPPGAQPVRHPTSVR